MNVVTGRLAVYLQQLYAIDRKPAAKGSHVAPYNIAGGDLPASAAHAAADLGDDVGYRQRVVGLVAHYVLDTAGRLWFTHATCVLTQLLDAKPRATLVMSKKLAQKIARKARASVRS
jgi:hypothetical protein